MILHSSSVIRKIVILILVTLISYSPTARASFWDALGACFSDFCNCGLDPIYRYEYHGGALKRKVKKNYVCPPWNKNGGRDDNTCLILKDYPGTPSGVYENLCAEATSDSTYFTPRIRVRGQQCNLLACWTTDDTLDWDGRCITLAGGYGAFPLQRMCARVALPKDTIRDFAQDPGYTNGVHVDTQGSTVQDKVILGHDRKPIKFESPKLCLYRDPAFISVQGSFDIDFLDLDPNRQSMHKTEKLHPVVEAILFFLNIVSDAKSALPDLIGSLFGLLDNGKDGETTFGSVMKDIFTFVGDLISWQSELVIKVLKEIGQIINRKVDDKEYGCVNIPMGPYPPPYCKNPVPFQIAQVQSICKTGSNGLPVKSISSAECNVSNVKNNYIRNSVRIGYEELVPLCKNGKNPEKTDKCVDIKNIGSFASAKGIHASTARRDIIKHCRDSTSTSAPCVQSMVPHKCSVTSNGCQDGFRIIYSQKLGTVSTPKAYYRDDIPDWPSSGSAVCQEIWGINRGEFVDISLTFPQEQTPSDTAPLVKSNIALVDKIGRTANLNASIVRVSSFNTLLKLKQNPKQICVFDGEFVVGCRDRATIDKPNIYQCENSPNPNVNCKSSYFTPQFIVSYRAGSDTTTAFIEPESVYNPDSLNNSISLAGDTFEAFVTDHTFARKPFSGSKAPNPSSVFGKYQDDIVPVSRKTINKNTVYLSGLEYINGKYHLGGEHSCLGGHSAAQCPQNPKMCVLAKLLNQDKVACSTFFAKSLEHGGVSLCSADQTSTCTKIDSFPLKSGGNIPIRSCANNIKCYDGAVNLCQISRNPSDRNNPSASLGDTLNDNMYYNTVIKGVGNRPNSIEAKYDADTEVVRDKTPIELGLCVKIPSGTCPAETEINADTGFAIWSSVKLGEIAHGTCPSDMIPKTNASDLVRQCIANPDTKKFNLEPVYRKKKDSNDKYYPTNVLCVKKDIQWYYKEWNEFKKQKYLSWDKMYKWYGSMWHELNNSSREDIKWDDILAWDKSIFWQIKQRRKADEGK